MLDLVIRFLAYLFLGGLWLSRWIDAGGGETARGVLFGWFAVSFLIYYPFCIAEFGSTLGKRICGCASCIVRPGSASASGAP